MLCPQCGKSVGDRPKLCESCKKENSQAEAQAANSIEEGGSETQRPDGVLHFVAYAGFWLRVWAYILDGAILSLILTLLSYLIALPIEKVLLPMASQLSSGSSLGVGILVAILLSALAVVLIQLLIGFLYFPLFESSYLHATPGKLLFKLRVVNNQGKALTKPNAFIRALARALPFFPLIIVVTLALLLRQNINQSQALGTFIGFCALLSVICSLIQYPLAAFTPDKQALHDLLAKTYVVRKEYLTMPETIARVVGVLIIAIILNMSFGRKDKAPDSFIIKSKNESAERSREG